MCDTRCATRRGQGRATRHQVWSGNALALLIALSVLCTANLGSQSAGRDLPLGFRSVAGVMLNRDSAATIRAALGMTRMRRTGSGHDAYLTWCFVPADRSSHALLELMSDVGDMGTPGHALTVIRVRADAPAADRTGCAPLPDGAGLSTPAGLRLGLGSPKIQDLLGPPTRRTADSLTYDFDAREYLAPGSPAYEIWNTLQSRESCFDAGPPFANVEASVIVVLSGGRAEEIRIERNDQSVC